MIAVADLLATLVATGRDVVPIVAVLVVFQAFVLRQPLPHLPRLIFGSICVLIGLALFLIGLELALFPVGRAMAQQLSGPQFVFGTDHAPADAAWHAYLWVYAFAALLGIATTIAEPSLLAVALKAEAVSRGNLRPWPLRIAVALGVGAGVLLGTWRIVTGTSLVLCMVIGYVLVIVQTAFAPRSIVPLAYDSGGVTTSTVSVPMITALGLGLASTVPGRNPAIDGFGLIAMASLFPMITVMGYAQLVAFRAGRRARAWRQLGPRPRA